MSSAQSSVSPSEALRRLQEGNDKFVAGDASFPYVRESELQRLVAEGQHPFVTIIGCSDSRVPPELLFRQGFGDIFVIRVAGNVCANDEIGSAEYGIDHLGTPLCVVLGHTHCGAVTAVLTGAPVHGCIPKLVSPIAVAADKVKASNPGADPGSLVPQAVEENVWHGIECLLTQSEAIRSRAGDGRLMVIGAVSDLRTGKVTWLGEHPKLKEMLG